MSQERIEFRQVEFLERLGTREQISLRMIHAERAQDAQLIEVLHAFGNHVAPECLA